MSDSVQISPSFGQAQTIEVSAPPEPTLIVSEPNIANAQGISYNQPMMPEQPSLTVSQPNIANEQGINYNQTTNSGYPQETLLTPEELGGLPNDIATQAAQPSDYGLNFNNGTGTYGNSPVTSQYPLNTPATSTANNTVPAANNPATPSSKQAPNTDPYSYGFDKGTIQQLEKQTNLTLYPYLFGGELARIKHQFSEMNINKYFLLLNFLVYGFDNQILQSAAQGHNKYVVDQGFINDFVKMSKQPLLQEALKKTPAYQKGCFNDLGKIGATEANANNLNANPATGPSTNSPNLIIGLVEKVLPGATQDLENFVKKIRTSAYLSLPKQAFSSIQHIVAAINGTIDAFMSMINDIYNGIIAYIQEVMAVINGLITRLQQMLISFIESIIPLDLLCILLAILSMIASDVGFHCSLFNMSSSILSNISNITSIINNPLGAATSFLPPEVSGVIGILQTNPTAFLSQMLANHGWAAAAQVLQGNIMGALATSLGPNFMKFNQVVQAVNFISNELASIQLPPQPPTMSPNLYANGTEDVYGNPTDPSKIPVNTHQAYQSPTLN